MFRRCIQNPANHQRRSIFARIVNGLHPLVILAKSQFLDILQGSGYNFDLVNIVYHVHFLHEKGSKFEYVIVFGGLNFLKFFFKWNLMLYSNNINSLSATLMYFNSFTCH